MFFFVLEKETENCEFERKDNKQGTDSSNHQENSRAKKECYINHCPALFILFHHPPSSTPIHTYTHFYKYFIYTLKYSLFCCVSSCSFFLSLSHTAASQKSIECFSPILVGSFAHWTVLLTHTHTKTERVFVITSSRKMCSFVNVFKMKCASFRLSLSLHFLPFYRLTRTHTWYCELCVRIKAIHTFFFFNVAHISLKNYWPKVEQTVGKRNKK